MPRPSYIASAAIALIAISVTTCAAAVTVGAARPGLYEPLLRGKRVALLSNHTGMVDSVTHTADLMLLHDIDLRVLLSPEHGFRGNADAGEHVASGRDTATGLPIVSMYDGRRRGLDNGTLSLFDVAVIDLQDVGARFYTYYITMLDLMADAARTGKEVIVLDRPNPLGMVVDGPILDMSLASGVGRIPVPVIHGLTMGEIALMANGEGWIKGGAKVESLTVIPCDGYTHATRYELPVPPSPNLPDMQAIYLYPSLCLFEGTPVSVGRGTRRPFTLYGHPDMAGHTFSFTPTPGHGSKNPPLKGQRCRGTDLSGISPDSILTLGMNLEYLIDAYRSMPHTDSFFTPFFDKLAGTRELRRQISNGMSTDEIRATWQPSISRYLAIRHAYLLYPEH